MLLNIPTIGVAKKYFHVEGLPSREDVMALAVEEFGKGAEITLGSSVVLIFSTRFECSFDLLHSFRV